jgi:hypothetical protein
MLEQSSGSGLNCVGETAQHISTYVKQGHEGIGFAAVHFDRVIGTCILRVAGDGLIASVAGFFAEFAASVAEVDKRLLSACIKGAKDLTLARTCAVAPARDRAMDTSFRNPGFKRDREKYECHRYGPLEILRRYELALPLYDPEEEVKER